MDWVDVGVVVIILASIVMGITRGLVVQVGGIVGAVAGLVLAKHEYKTAEAFLSVFFHKDAHLAMAAFILVFLIAWALVATIAAIVRGAVRLTPFGVLDRLGGAVIGLILGLLTVEVLLLLASGTHDRSLHVSIHASRLAPAFERAIPGLRGLIPRRLPHA